jgi:cytochrome c oxidase subunit III
MTPTPPRIDVSDLPRHVFGGRDTAFWGAGVLVAVEGTATLLLVAVYFYLRARYDVWPPIPPGSTASWCAVVGAAVLALSLVPMYLSGKGAAEEDVARTRRWLLVALVLGFVFLALRVAELLSLGFRWDSNAHGSIFWVLQAFHGALAGVELVESVLFAALLSFGPVEKTKLSHIDADTTFWTFMVLTGVGQFLLLYLDAWGWLP